MTTLVECWNKLDGNVGELSSWVAAKVVRINWPSICMYTVLLQIPHSLFLRNRHN